MTSPSRRVDGPVATPTLLHRVPMVTGYFWAIKVLVTPVGDAADDLLDSWLGVGPTVTSAVIIGLFVAGALLHMRVGRYVPMLYWLVVLLAGAVGTRIPESLSHTVSVDLDVAIVCVLALALIFGAWLTMEQTLSLASIYTARREGFYWLAVLFTFGLGAAIGDLLEALSLPYLVATSVFAVLIGLVALTYIGVNLHPVAAFWLVYMLTCPFGWELGNYLARPYREDLGGLGLGVLNTSVAGALLVLALVGYLTVSRRDQLPAGPHPDDPVYGGHGGDHDEPQHSEAAFVEAYYAKLPHNTSSAYDDLTPAFQRRIGGVQGFHRRYRDVVSVVIVDEPVVVGPHAVSVTVRARFRRGRTVSERLLLRVELAPGGGRRLRLDDIVWRS